MTIAALFIFIWCFSAVLSVGSGQQPEQPRLATFQVATAFPAGAVPGCCTIYGVQAQPP